MSGVILEKGLLWMRGGDLEIERGEKERKKEDKKEKNKKDYSKRREGERKEKALQSGRGVCS